LLVSLGDMLLAKLKKKGAPQKSMDEDKVASEFSDGGASNNFLSYYTIGGPKNFQNVFAVNDFSRGKNMQGNPN
jgi:hypothetical protein